jgi:hypothetical protein
MKAYYKIRYSILLIFSIATLLSSCGGDNGEELIVEETTNRQLKTGTWKVRSVKVDGVDHTDLYTGLTLTFSETTVNVSNPNPVWPSSTTWSFTDPSSKLFRRGDGVEVTITSISDTNLVLTLNWDETTIGGGRTASISGSH